MNLVDTALAPPDPAGCTESAGHTASTGYLRRRVVGIDLFAEHPLGIDQVVAEARARSVETHLRLVAAFDQTGSAPVVSGNEDAALRLRFLARQDDVHVTDEAICELLARLSGRLRWSQLSKLEEFDGIPAFVPLPSP
ncbi:MAG: hypothetical protein ACYCTL_02550 [Acidimicrobiales bacterium]